MCLAVPLKIVELREDGQAVGLFNDIRVEFSTDLIQGASIGSYALVHAGVAIEMVDQDQALKTISLIEEYARDELS